MPRSNQKRSNTRRNSRGVKGKQQDKTRTVIGREREMGEKTIPDETIKRVHEYYKALKITNQYKKDKGEKDNE